MAELGACRRGSGLRWRKRAHRCAAVVHQPQVGNSITQMWLTATLTVVGNDSFRNARELRGTAWT